MTRFFLLLLFTTPLWAQSHYDPTYYGTTGWRFWADYLYMRPTRSGLDYAVAQSGNNFDGPVSRVDPDWESGYRLALFKEGVCSCWDLGGIYTQFDASSENSTSGALAATRLGNDMAPTSFDEADATYSLCYERLELEAGYCIHLNWLHTIVRPFLSVNFAWIDQKMISNYSEETTPEDMRSTQKLGMDGYGLAAGLSMHWRLCKRLSFLGQLKGAVVHGDFSASWLEQDMVMAGQTLLSTSDDQTLVVSMYEFLAGLDFYLFCAKTYDLSVFVGYEFQNWRLPDFLSTTSDLDRNSTFLGLEGLVARVRLSF